MCIEKENGIRGRDDRSSGCGIVVKKEQECGPCPDPILNFAIYEIAWGTVASFAAILRVVTQHWG